MWVIFALVAFITIGMWLAIYGLSSYRLGAVVVGVIMSIAGLLGYGLFYTTAAVEDKSEVEVLETRELHAFEVSEREGVELEASAWHFLLYDKVSLNGETVDDGSEYIVMEDELGDGGMKKKSYPVEDVRVYEDADAESARVEEVKIHYDFAEGTVFGIPVSGYLRYREEVHIHVPEGTLEMARLDSAQ